MDVKGPGIKREDVVAALEFWGGNVKRAAVETLRISRQALYEKLEMFDLHAEDFRKVVTSRVDSVKRDSAVGVSEGVRVRELGLVPTLEAVMSVAGEALMEAAMDVLEPARRPAKVDYPKLPRCMVDEYQAARLQLQALTGVETTNAELAIRFHRQCFQRFIAEEMERARSKGGAK